MNLHLLVLFLEYNVTECYSIWSCMFFNNVRSCLTLVVKLKISHDIMIYLLDFSLSSLHIQLNQLHMLFVFINFFQLLKSESMHTPSCLSLQPKIVEPF
jgi:hypothetical protein